MSVEDFRHHLVAAKHKMSAVAARAGRSQYDVQLIAVSKASIRPVYTRVRNRTRPKVVVPGTNRLKLALMLLAHGKTQYSQLVDVRSANYRSTGTPPMKSLNA
ncbi:hypothetical protein [Arthrobacter polaris]|uniref:hypothetical protein n=1 Tax=Arthrobacter polaris TaxID=2813727 RepID=UPI003D7F1559